MAAVTILSITEPGSEPPWEGTDPISRRRLRLPGLSLLGGRERSNEASGIPPEARQRVPCAETRAQLESAIQSVGVRFRTYKSISAKFLLTDLFDR